MIFFRGEMELVSPRRALTEISDKLLCMFDTRIC